MFVISWCEWNQTHQQYTSANDVFRQLLIDHYTSINLSPGKGERHMYQTSRITFDSMDSVNTPWLRELSLFIEVDATVLFI